MTSLLRELVPVPKVEANSMTTTSLPLSASSLATAIPTTPAPITTQSTDSLATALSTPTLLVKFLEEIHLLEFLRPLIACLSICAFFLWFSPV